MKQVRIAELKAKLSAYLRGVQRGDTLTVLDRDTPIARIVPYAEGHGPIARRSPRTSAALHRVPLPPALRVGVDVVDLLLEERQSRR